MVVNPDHGREMISDRLNEKTASRMRGPYKTSSAKSTKLTRAPRPTLRRVRSLAGIRFWMATGRSAPAASAT